MAFQSRLAKQMGLTTVETTLLRKLSTPLAIQDFLTGMPSNPEPDGDTCYSVRRVLQHRCCHCIEAAFVAACALMLHGKPALIMDMTSSGDDDHVLALFKQGKYWGAISKSNHIWLRWRDPVYRSLRELTMSYFHEYVRDTQKTLRSYSVPINLGAIDPALWVTNPDSCWEVAGRLESYRHHKILTPSQARNLRKREAFEVRAGRLLEF
jgi:hypothetical protein